MNAYSWRNASEKGYTYDVQLQEVEKSEKSKVDKAFAGWKQYGFGWHLKTGSKLFIFRKTFKSEREWKLWAKQFPIKLLEYKYRKGKEIEIQHSCKTRKKRKQNAKTKKQ